MKYIMILIIALLVIMLTFGFAHTALQRSDETLERIDRHIEEVLDR